MSREQHPANVLFREVATFHPHVYEEIRRSIRPHSMESVVSILKRLLDGTKVSLDLFNRHRQNIPTFLLEFTKRIVRNFPQPGDAFGIQLTCRLTKNDTQSTLDSRHLRCSGGNPSAAFDAPFVSSDKDLKYELELYSVQSQILEISNSRKYSSIFLRGYAIQDLLEAFPYTSCWLRGRTATNFLNRPVHLATTRFVLIVHRHPIVRIVYRAYVKELNYLLNYLDGKKILAFNDVKYVYQKCGISSYYLNMIRVARLTIGDFGDGSGHSDVSMSDLLKIVKYQCRTGVPLALNRNGLAKNPNRSPLEVLSFEAPKRNYVRLCTTRPEIRKEYPVITSTDKMFFGQQFNEGTGYAFEIIPGDRNPHRRDRSNEPSKVSRTSKRKPRTNSESHSSSDSE